MGIFSGLFKGRDAPSNRTSGSCLIRKRKKGILEQTVICADEEIAALDEKIKAVQLELVDKATSSEEYDDLVKESDRLNEEKQKIQM